MDLLLVFLWAIRRFAWQGIHLHQCPLKLLKPFPMKGLKHIYISESRRRLSSLTFLFSGLTTDRTLSHFFSRSLFHISSLAIPPFTLISSFHRHISRPWACISSKFHLVLRSATFSQLVLGLAYIICRLRLLASERAFTRSGNQSPFSSRPVIAKILRNLAVDSLMHSPPFRAPEFNLTSMTLSSPLIISENRIPSVFSSNVTGCFRRTKPSVHWPTSTFTVTSSWFQSERKSRFGTFEAGMRPRPLTLLLKSEFYVVLLDIELLIPLTRLMQSSLCSKRRVPAKIAF